MTSRAGALVLGAGLAAVLLARSPALTVPFTLPKLLAMEVFVAALAIVYAVRAARGSVKAPAASLVLPISVLVAWWVISTLTAVDLRTSLFGSYGRYMGLLTHLAMAAVFVILATGTKPSEVERAAFIIVMAIVPVAAVAILQYLGSLPMGLSGDAQLDLVQRAQTRAYGTIGHPVPFAALVGLGAPFACVLLLRQEVAWRRGAAAIILALLLAASAASLSRGPWIGTAIALLVLAAACSREAPLRVRRRALGALALTAVCAVVFIGPHGFDPIVRRLATLAGSADPSVSNRFAYARTAIRIARDHPVTGGGFDSFALLYPRYRPRDAPGLPIDAIPTMVHNGYLHILSTNGLPALLAYLALAGAIIARLFQRWRHARTVDARLLAAAFGGAIAGFMVQDLSGWEELPVTLTFWAVLGLAAAFVRPEAPLSPASADRPPRQRLVLASAAAVAVLMAGAAGETLEAIGADRSLADARRLSLRGEWPLIKERLADAVRDARVSPHVEDAAGVLYLERYALTHDDETYHAAARLFADAARQNPHAPYPLIHRVDLETLALSGGRLRAVSRDVETAVARLERLDPGNPTVHESVARLRIAQGHPAEGLAQIRQAMRLQPRHRRYAIWEGDALRALGDRKGALEAYRRGVRLASPSHGEWLVLERRIVLALLELDLRDEADVEAAALLRQVEDPQTRAALAAAHAAR